MNTFHLDYKSADIIIGYRADDSYFSFASDFKEWYKKKAFRDQTARRQYLDVERNRRQRGDLYITTILDEEMKPNDPRLR